MKKKKKLPPVVEWEGDIQFWAGTVRIRARTAGEAKKKMFQKLKDNPKMILKWINKKNSYVDKVY